MKNQSDNRTADNSAAPAAPAAPFNRDEIELIWRHYDDSERKDKAYKPIINPSERKVKEHKALTTHADENAGKRVSDRLRSRRFSIVTYIDVKSLRRFLDSSRWVQHFALICHDKDKNDDGTPKTVHCHLLLTLYEAKTCSAVRKIFERYAKDICPPDVQPQNTLVQVTRDMVSQYRYLLHLDNPDKTPYFENEIMTDNYEYWRELVGTEGMSDSGRNVGLSIFTDVLRGVSTVELVRRYGQNYVINARHYDNLAQRHYGESGGDISVNN